MTVAPARRVAFEVVRRAFEHEAWADRALRSASQRHGLEGRERAQAQRLAYGAVQRRGTSDHLIERLADRPVSKLDAPALAALRLGLFELLFADAIPDHAAVDQAVELAKGNAGRRRQAAAGLVNAVLRRAAREREELLGSLDDATPRDAALAHSYPEWLARMWWEELGPAEARALMAAMNEPAETALRVNTIRADPSSILGELRAAGDEVERPDAPPPLATPESLIVRGRLGALARQRIADGAVVPQARGSQAVVALLDPQARRARARPLRRAGDQDHRDRGANAKRGRDRRGRARPRSGAQVCASSASGWASPAFAWSKRMRRAPTSEAATIGSSWIPRAPILARLPPGPTHGGGSRPS